MSPMDCPQHQRSQIPIVIKLYYVCLMFISYLGTCPCGLFVTNKKKNIALFLLKSAPTFLENRASRQAGRKASLKIKHYLFPQYFTKVRKPPHKNVGFDTQRFREMTE